MEMGERANRMPDGHNRKDIYPGLEVSIVLKEDQRTGKLTQGIVKDILTKSLGSKNAANVAASTSFPPQRMSSNTGGTEREPIM